MGTVVARLAELVICPHATHKFSFMPAKYLGGVNENEAGKIQERRKAKILPLGTT